MQRKSSAALHPFAQSVPDLMKDWWKKSQQLHVIPASYQIEEALKLPGTKVLMKNRQKNAGSKSTDQSIW